MTKGERNKDIGDRGRNKYISVMGEKNKDSKKTTKGETLRHRERDMINERDQLKF